MIPKTCPISDKMKLHETLNGECSFALFIPDKFCFGCSFYEAELRKRTEESKRNQEQGMLDGWKADDRGW
jgi:hypothetical protein